MKYSIVAEKPIVAPIPQSKLSKAFSNYNETYGFSLIECTRIQLFHFTFQKQQTNSPTKTTQITEEYVLEDQIDWQRLKHMTVTQDEWILLLERPFQIIFCLRKYKTVIPIVLETELQIEQMACYVTYPEAIIYAYSTKNNSNVMYTLNLHTFQIKPITTAKEYFPNERTRFWSHFSDSRLYVMGGERQDNAAVDKLMWTYNMQNCYWFALQVNEIIGSSLKCEFENGKVLAIGSEEIYIVQLYQSRVVKVQNWKEFLAVQALKLIRGVYIFEDWIYLLGEDKQLPKLKVTKIKLNTL